MQKRTDHCRQCGAALYRSSDKFDSGCGWPSFDCVNSVSLDFVPPKKESAIFAGGCFWGVEVIYDASMVDYETLAKL